MRGFKYRGEGLVWGLDYCGEVLAQGEGYCGISAGLRVLWRRSVGVVESLLREFVCIMGKVWRRAEGITDSVMWGLWVCGCRGECLV